MNENNQDNFSEQTNKLNTLKNQPYSSASDYPVHQPEEANPFSFPSNTNQQNSDQTSQIHNQKPSQPSKSFVSRIVSFFKTIGILILILLVACTSLFVYIILNPNSDFSRTIANLPGIRDQISLPNSTSSSSSSSDKPVNQLLGLQQEQPTNLTFSTPSDAKTTTEVVNQVLPSVLSLSIVSKTKSLSFAGTGYVVSKDGLIVTNKHVIAPLCQSSKSDFVITAISSQDKIYQLNLLSVDPVYDLAILQVSKTENTSAEDLSFSAVSFADPKNIRLGMEVLAVGNAFGEFQNTVTKGIVSGLNRNIETGLVDECSKQAVVADGLIQTDASINPGNSGGPLFNASGQVIGMNTFGSSAAENIGLAIPSSIIVSSLNSFLENKIIIRPRIGVQSQSINPNLKRLYPFLPTDYGEFLFTQPNASAIVPNSSADQAGLKTGDIILSLNGVDLKASQANPAPLRSNLISLKPKQEVTLKVLRQNGVKNGVYTYPDLSTASEVKIILGELKFDLK